jgi:hypothetical protein
MRLEEKIEAIRRQPDQVRLRWVWGSVIISMLIIFIIWLFSINLMFKNGNNETPQPTDKLVSDLKDQTSQIKEQAKSLKATTESLSQPNQAEGVSTSQENPVQRKTDLAPSAQSSQYTELENTPE